METLVSVRGLKTEFLTTRGVVHAVDGVDLDVGKGEVLGVVGESGCGKSVTALSIMYLVPQPPGVIAGGEIWLGDVNLLAGPEGEVVLRHGRKEQLKVKRRDSLLKKHRARMNKVRGREMSMIFQEPMSSLNPVLPVGYQVSEVLIYQRTREICERLLSRKDLSKEDLDVFNKAVATAEADERDRLATEFCVRTGLDPDKIVALLEASGLSSQERLERVRRLAQRRRIGSRWFLRFLTRLSTLEQGHFDREWRRLSRYSLGKAAQNLLDPAKSPDALGLPRLTRISPGETALRLMFSENPASEKTRSAVEALLRRHATRPDGIMFAGVKQIVLANGAVELRFPPLPEGAFRDEAQYRTAYLSYRFILGLPLIRRRLMKPIEAEARRQVLDLLKLVRIPEPTKVYYEYPHELSGGMQQRVMIAMALACDPALLIADEPTTALDVTTQAQILKLIKDLRTRVNSAILYITHDLAVIAEISDRVAVMYAGKVVEDAPVKELFAHPMHPYAQGLLESIVTMDSHRVELGKSLPTIPGTVPDLRNPPTGCRFHPRCQYAWERCRVEVPPLVPRGPDHKVACHLYDPKEAGRHDLAR